MQELDHVRRKTPVFLDPFHMALDEIAHVAHRFLDRLLFRDFLARLEHRLNGFRASAGAGPMNALPATPMMSAEFPAGLVQERFA